MGGEELKWRQLDNNQLMSSQGLILVHAVQLKPTIKVQMKNGSGISDVVTASVYLEKNSLKKLMMMKMIIIIIITEKPFTSK